MKVLVLYGSSRSESNTELLTERLIAGLDATRIRLRERRIEPIHDQRHDPAGFTPVDDDQEGIIRAMLAHDLVIFATPLYWYGMSGPMKDFVDRWSQSLRDPRLNFKQGIKGKEAWVVITGGPDGRIKGLTLIEQFVHIFNFVEMNFAGYLIGTGGKPGQVLEDGRALLEADWLNQQFKAR